MKVPLPGFKNAFAGKTVWVSGHTGFKGAWLCEWLLALGARVHGFSVDVPTDPALFDQLELSGRMAKNEVADIRDARAVRRSIDTTAPDYVFHLAAQPLVLKSYDDPEPTWNINVNGTIHLLEALRHLDRPCAAIIVTSDKSYENHETGQAYVETDSLGGFDPYSASKGAAEVATSAWRRSFFLKGPVRVASARAGNVIGGGDWAPDRIVPDCVRYLSRDTPIQVRNRHAVRPWQHVLEPLSGYLWLAASMASGDWAPTEAKRASAAAFNFGPDDESNRTVKDLVEEVLKHWPGIWIDQTDPKAVHEAGLLALATGKARAQLGWRPVWNFSEAIAHTVDWYQGVLGGASAAQMTRAQIEAYCRLAVEYQVRWTSV
ncbi:MAG TPA: CDP-glucose 4,6-dehydratase [Candidatus Limnocylindria bacterium]|jgi:CDP-glucose 4,6-dehydratase|nr:CDP-glucose 4,6-dehydratase [Candidatus Limnocylindria bacterium]